MKKLGIFIAASALTLSLAACGSGASKPQQQLPQKLQRQQVLQLN